MQTIAQQWIEEGRKVGLEEGLEKGMEVGLEKGQEHGAIQATRENIFELLEARFGTIRERIRIGALQ
jgi:flagellar biosynthesis/type III secretory pathway protein FliH